MGELLIRKGANINAKINEKRLLRQFHGFEIARGFRGFRENGAGKTPLHMAAKKNLKMIGEILISKGINVNTKDIIYQIIIILFFN